MNAELKRITDGMDESQLAELAADLREVRNARTAVDLNSIKPGMKAEDSARVREEIVRILGEL